MTRKEIKALRETLGFEKLWVVVLNSNYRNRNKKVEECRNCRMSAHYIDFTLSNARRFYSSMGNPLDGKGLKQNTHAHALSVFNSRRKMTRFMSQ